MSPQTVTGHRTGVTLGSAASTSRAISQSACCVLEGEFLEEEEEEERRGRVSRSRVSFVFCRSLPLSRAINQAIIFSFFLSFLSHHHLWPSPHLDLRFRQRAAPQQPLDLRVELRAGRGVRQRWRGRHFFRFRAEQSFEFDGLLLARRLFLLSQETRARVLSSRSSCSVSRAASVARAWMRALLELALGASRERTACGREGEKEKKRWVFLFFLPVDVVASALLLTRCFSLFLSLSDEQSQVLE